MLVDVRSDSRGHDATDKVFLHYHPVDHFAFGIEQVQVQGLGTRSCCLPVAHVGDGGMQEGCQHLRTKHGLTYMHMYASSLITVHRHDDSTWVLFEMGILLNQGLGPYIQNQRTHSWVAANSLSLQLCKPDNSNLSECVNMPLPGHATEAKPPTVRNAMLRMRSGASLHHINHNAQDTHV